MEDDKSTLSSSTTTEEVSLDAMVDGELQMLRESVNDLESPPLPESFQNAVLKKTSSGVLIDDEGHGVYGRPASESEAAVRMPDLAGGHVWNALVIPDEYFKEGKLQRGLQSRDFDLGKQQVKPRRASLPLTSTDFFSSLTMIPSTTTPGAVRFVFSGVLNGWPGLRHLELVSLEQRRSKTTAIPSPKELVSGQILWMSIWKADEQGAKGEPPCMLDVTRVHRARLRGAAWTANGWSKDSPGFVFWYQSQQKQAERRLLYGSKMTEKLEDCQCTYIHMFSHRYARVRESPKDKLTYHSICILEWEHGQYVTVVEMAYLNGIGGYRGKSNWYEDTDIPPSEGTTALYQAFPPELILPWRSDMSEIRCYDLKGTKTMTEFTAFVETYTGPTKRFVDPRMTHSYPARLTFRSKEHIAQYLINYISRDSSYAELKRNCQTFTADLCSFVAGKKNIAPFHPVSRIDYQTRTHLFLYDSNMYEKKKK